MYVFYIVDWLGRPARLRRPSGLSENGFFSPNDPDLGSWTSRFVKAGGLRLLFSIFASGDLQSRDGTVWYEWRQDCLSALVSKQSADKLQKRTTVRAPLTTAVSIQKSQF